MLWCVVSCTEVPSRFIYAATYTQETDWHVSQGGPHKGMCNTNYMQQHWNNYMQQHCKNSVPFSNCTFHTHSCWCVYKHMPICICVCICMYIYICMCVCIYIYVYTRVYLCECIYTQTECIYIHAERERERQRERERERESKSEGGRLRGGRGLKTGGRHKKPSQQQLFIALSVQIWITLLIWFDSQYSSNTHQILI